MDLNNLLVWVFFHLSNIQAIASAFLREYVRVDASRNINKSGPETLLNVREWMCTFFCAGCCQSQMATANNKTVEIKSCECKIENFRMGNGIWKWIRSWSIVVRRKHQHQHQNSFFFLLCDAWIVGIIVRSPHWYRFQLVCINDFAIILHTLMIFNVWLSELTSHLAVANSFNAVSFASTLSSRSFPLSCTLLARYRWTLLPLILCARDFLVSFNRPNSWMNGWWKKEMKWKEKIDTKSQEKYNGISFSVIVVCFLSLLNTPSYN